MSGARLFTAPVSAGMGAVALCASKVPSRNFFSVQVWRDALSWVIIGTETERAPVFEHHNGAFLVGS